MYFTECVRLAERHPDLAAVIEQVDAQLQDMGSAEVVRVGDFASYLRVDPNQVTSVFEMLADEGLLLGEEMIECPNCRMVVLRSDYERALAEEGEFHCTECHKPLSLPPAQTITTYRRGEKWKATPPPKPSSDVALDDEAWYTYPRLAEVFKVGKGALRKRLENFQRKSLDGWKESEDRRPREPKYLYRLKMIRHIIVELQSSSERPAK